MRFAQAPPDYPPCSGW